MSSPFTRIRDKLRDSPVNRIYYFTFDLFLHYGEICIVRHSSIIAVLMMDVYVAKSYTYNILKISFIYNYTVQNKIKFYNAKRIQYKL